MTKHSRHRDTPADRTGAAGLAASGAVEVVRSEERLRTGVQRVPVERVIVSTRIVTETRTFTVDVRREELVIARAPIAAGQATPEDGSPEPGQAGQPVVELTLREEVPEILTRVVPVERIRVYRDRVEGAEQVQAALSREEVELSDTRDAPTGGGRRD